MSESTTPAQCRDEDWSLARDCGLMDAAPGTNAWDAALGRFADGVRAAPVADSAGGAEKAGQGIEFWKRMVSCLAGMLQDAAPIVGKEPGEESAGEIGRLLKERAVAAPAQSAAPAALTDALHYLRMGIENLSLGNGVHMVDFRNAERTLLAASPAAPTGDAAVHGDDVAVDMFAKAMKEKLAQARSKGRSGWQTCSKYELSNMLREHVEKGDPRDVANFCMFLHALGHPIQVAPRQPEDSAEADKRDAARYRWLRDSDRIPSEEDDADGHIVVGALGGEDLLWTEQLDGAIDEELRAVKEGNGNG